MGGMYIKLLFPAYFFKEFIFKNEKGRSSDSFVLEDNNVLAPASASANRRRRIKARRSQIL